MDSSPQLERRAILTAIAVALVILYGSLFPFAFHRNGSPVDDLLASAQFRPVRIDFAANVLLYTPFGSAIFLAARGRRPRLAWVCAFSLGFVISLCTEIAQTYDAGRYPSIYDVVANTMGSIGGAALAWAYGKRAPSSSQRTEHIYSPFILILFACWAGFWFFPYRLSFDPVEYWHIFRRLVFAPPLSYAHLFQSFARWMVIAALLEAVYGSSHGRRAFAGFLALALFFRAWVGPGQLTNEYIWSAILALVLWCSYVWRRPWRAYCVAGLMVLAIALDALAPYQFSITGRSFGMVPFTSFVNAPRGSALYSMFSKLFAYGTLLWATTRAGWPWHRAVAGCTAFVLVLRIIQIYLPGRSAEITDALMVLALGILLRWLKEEPEKMAATQH